MIVRNLGEMGARIGAQVLDDQTVVDGLDINGVAAAVSPSAEADAARHVIENLKRVGLGRRNDSRCDTAAMPARTG